MTALEVLPAAADVALPAAKVAGELAERPHDLERDHESLRPGLASRRRPA
jgi:hypothetical protein